MKNIKAYLAILSLVLLCQATNGQRIRGITYNPIIGPFNYEIMRFRDAATLPYKFFPSADTGSVSFRNNTFYGKKVVNGVETWVPLLDSLSVPSADITDVYQYSSNNNVTVGDTTTALVLNRDSVNTVNRTVALKDPAAFKGKSFKIFNYNTGSFRNELSSPIINTDGQPISILPNGVPFILNSDGITWRAIGAGNSGGGSNLIPIVSF